MSKGNEDGFKGKLKTWLAGAEKVAVVGVGNAMRKDDAVGVEIVKILRKRVSSRISLIEAETMPENYIEQIIDFCPSHVLIIDSGLIGEKPGKVKFLALTETSKTAISTHMLPLQVFCAYIEKAINAKILLLVIQPKDTGMGEDLTKELKETAGKIADFLVKILP